MVPKKEATPKRKPTTKKKQMKTPLPATTQKQQPDKRPKKPEYIVGIGGSAGSLEALEMFFRAMPVNEGLAFVLIVHLEPSHKSITDELIQRCTTMKVSEARDNMTVESNAVYIIPPGKDLSILNGTIQLMDVTGKHGIRLPIDYFFRSLAKDLKERSVGIILSGMGTDGMLGMRAIQEVGGMTMVQDPASAKFNSMPRSVIQNRLVDFILTPEKMPETLLIDVKKSPTVISQKAVERMELAKLQKILVLIRDQTGNDFFEYKNSSLLRRVERRMSLRSIDEMADYVIYLQAHPEEVDLLFGEILIGVTNFFRDPEAFEHLKTTILWKLKEYPPALNVFRAWCPGCATGEEAFSVAIIIQECLEECHLQDTVRIKIYGTDIGFDSIEFARKGRYPKNIAADVPSTYLKKWFVEEEDAYVVHKDIRKSVIFAVQNPISDPPFTKLDLISCRNLLIYFTTELQKKIIPLFSYALCPHGILFLGTSESLSSEEKLFLVLDKKWKIFERSTISSLIGDGVPPVIGFTPVTRYEGRAGVSQDVSKNIPDLIGTILLEHYTPPSLLVNIQGDIVYFSGKTGAYLEPAPGKPDLNIFSMIRQECRIEFGTAFHQVQKEYETVTVHGLHTMTGGQEHYFDIIIDPVESHSDLKDQILVIFRDLPPKPKHWLPWKTPEIEGKNTFELEEELKKLKVQLAYVLGDKQTKEEEFKSMNEELQSSNEELQSTNEELSTSKEEMQSLNEELQAVNAEIENKNNELSRVNADVKNLLNITDIATILLDREMLITQFTTKILPLYNLIDSDIGRPLSDIVTKLAYDQVILDAKQVFDTLIIQEKNVQTKDGVKYFMRIVPYKTQDNKIDGVVITFMNIMVPGNRDEPLKKV